MDLQGADVARPWLERAGATYTRLVDATNMLGERYHFKFIPLTILYDEPGRLVRGPTATNIDKTEDRALLQEWIRDGVDSRIARTANDGTESPQTQEPGFASKEAELRFHLAVILFQSHRVNEAVTELKRAFALDPENWLIRKQMWALENPDKFYSGDVDYGWQREQIAAGQ